MSDKKVVLVLGGTGIIGKKICEKLLIKGYRVIFTWGHNKTRALEQFEAFQSMFDRSQFKMVQLSSSQELKGIVDKILEYEEANHFGFIANVGHNSGRRTLDELEANAFRQDLENNLVFPFEVTRQFALHLDRKKKSCTGAIVFISSQVAKFGSANLVSYCAAKGGINSMALSFSRMFGEIPISVNVASLGIMSESFEARADIPLGRAGQPKEVAEVVEFLVGGSVPFLNGTVIPVHGGR